MAFYLLERKPVDGVSSINDVKAMIIEADSAAVAKQVADAQTQSDSGWSEATVTAVAAGVAADYDGFVYRVRVSGGAGNADILDVSVTGDSVWPGTVDDIGYELSEAIRGSDITAAIADDGGVFTDETTEANEGTSDDMTLYPVVPAQDDAYYFGFSWTVARLFMWITTAGVGTYTVAWEYWDGNSWETLTVTDGTAAFKNSGLWTVTWTPPSDWATTTVNSQGPFYYIRAVIDNGTVTTVPLAGQAYKGPGLQSWYTSGTNTLTVADAQEGVGDRTLSVTAKLPGADEGIAALIGTITDGGAAGSALTVVLEDETAIPAILSQI
jgi:hypothetical protein